jgi:RNA polymerase sigma-70 factor (ECF subfamily)
MNGTEDMAFNELEDLLRKARKGESTALASLCEKYYRKVLKFMYYHVGERRADDLTNEVFLKVMRNIRSQKGRFEPWLYRIARNLVIDNVRHWQASPEVEMDESLAQRVGNGSDGHSALLARMDVHDGLKRLRAEYRELLTLKFIQGLSNPEISEITGQKPGAIRVMQFRALAALRESLSREDG